jgi:RNA polymerase sigma-70 factor (ECF subfamily)
MSEIRRAEDILTDLAEAIPGRSHWESSFADLYPRLRRLAGAIAAPDGEPDDLLQEAVANLLARDGDPVTDLMAFLARAMINLESTRKRRASRLRLLLPRVASSGSTVASMPSDLSLLNVLDPLSRTVVFLADVEGYPLNEVARLLDREPTAIRTRAVRARRRLRRLLEAES